MPSEPSATNGGSSKSKIVVDSVHGDIRPSAVEWKVIDTPAFQRLRKLKQLQMGYLVYPNATHTRFAHSLGVLKVMQRILDRVRAEEEEKTDLRLAALMHDIGHYPYSHLLEGVDRVVLTEERVGSAPKSPLGPCEPYPDHEQVGQAILLGQADLVKILGGEERARRIGHLFARTEVADQQLSKLIHSSLDMDRLDYLIRDSQATGVPYGLVDIHYLLNHVKQSKQGAIGITHKAVAAAEHLLLARSFLFRVVCQHKTTYGFEEVARQLLRRLRDRVQVGKGGSYKLPKDGKQILAIARSKELYSFTDAYLDDLFVQAASDGDELIRILANTIVSRRPPRLLWEKRTFRKRDDDHNDETLFHQHCQLSLPKFAKDFKLKLGQFLICTLKPIGFESRGPQMSKVEAKKAIEAGEQEEMIKVFPTPEAIEPVDIVELKHSLLHEIGSHVFRTYRLYLVCKDDAEEARVPGLKDATSAWS